METHGGKNKASFFLVFFVFFFVSSLHLSTNKSVNLPLIPAKVADFLQSIPDTAKFCIKAGSYIGSRINERIIGRYFPVQLLKPDETSAIYNSITESMNDTVFSVSRAGILL